METKVWDTVIITASQSVLVCVDSFPYTVSFNPGNPRTSLALEKEMATHSSVLARRIPGMGEPGGLPSMGSHRVGHD